MRKLDFRGGILSSILNCGEFNEKFHVFCMLVIRAFGAKLCLLKLRHSRSRLHRYIRANFSKV